LGFYLKFFPGGWRIAVFSVAMLVAVPVLVIFYSLLVPTDDVWDHLVNNVLNNLLINTFWLVLGVSIITSVIGVSLAWITATCDFPARAFFSWALLLPLAMPAYVLAFVFIVLLNFSGPVQSTLRMWIPPEYFWFPNARSTWGVVTVMSLALYPYVYLIVRNGFITQGMRTIEAAQSLGFDRRQGFFKIILPMVRPWIAGGLMLVIMETLADFGAVSIFNFDTFTTAIYKSWFGFFSIDAAAQLSSILVIFVFIVIIVEQRMRAKMRYSQTGRGGSSVQLFKLNGVLRWTLFGYSSSVLLIAFIIPCIQLIIWTLNVIEHEFTSRYYELLTNSLMLGILASLLTCILALIISYAKRHHPDKPTGFLVKISTLGYAMPGTILAVGIFIPTAYVDNLLIALSMQWFQIERGPLLQGTLLVMVFAFMVRFMAVGFNSIDSSMHRITKNIDEAARGMGIKGFNMLRRIHIPILKSGILTAATLVFLDVMKEMPITLMTRPFGWDSLSVKIYELTSEGEWERAALPSITLVLAGLIPIFLLMRKSDKL